MEPFDKEQGNLLESTKMSSFSWHSLDKSVILSLLRDHLSFKTTIGLFINMIKVVFSESLHCVKNRHGNVVVKRYEMQTYIYFLSKNLACKELKHI